VTRLDDGPPRSSADPFGSVRSPRRARARGPIVAAVFAGGCVGGLARYAATTHWPGAVGGLPWSTLVVNVVGAFVLALLVVVVADVLGPSTYLRPLVGTGFCGALTTFSSVVVVTDRLAVHGRAGLAAAYLAASIAGGLAAGMLGLGIGRAFGAYRRRVADGKGT
jgi:fluoride exporter